MNTIVKCKTCSQIYRGDACPKCYPMAVVVEDRPSRLANAAPAPNTVDFGVNIPNVGGIKTKVSPKTAETGLMVFLGGVVALMGVIVCAMFGIRPSGKA